MKNWKLGLGACLCTVGALGIILEPVLGFAKLGRPWSFMLGFSVGLISGLGAALSIAGLAGLRRPPAAK